MGSYFLLFQEYLKRHGYLDGVKYFSSEGGNAISVLANKAQIVERKDGLEEVRPRDTFMNVMAYTENNISKVIKNFQKMHGVKQTGTLNKNMVELMGRPRCWMSGQVGDFFVKTHSREEGFAPKGNKRPPRALGKKILITYNIVSSGKRLTQTEVRTTIKKAFRKWAEVTPLVFRRSSGNADIKITFHEGKEAFL